MIVNHINKSNATTETNSIMTTNLFNTDGTINTVAANTLLEAVGYYDHAATTTGYKAHQIRTRNSSSSYNGDTTIIFPMGYYNGTDIYWQATYLYNNYLTIWMVKNYAYSTWNEGDVSVNYTNYANSTIQNYLDNTLWSALTMGSGTLQSIFALPSNVGYQSTSAENIRYWYNSRYTATYNNLASAVATGSYLWLPSFGEVLNNTSSEYESNTTTYTGQWGLNSTDRSFNTSNYDGTSTSWCWLRSGYSGNSKQAMQVTSSAGFAAYYGVVGRYGVRPAAHLSLNQLASEAGYTISASLASGATDRAQINGSNSAWSGKYTNGQGDLNITYTSNSNYYINSITLNGTSVTINESAPASYSTLGSSVCQYKVWRNNANTVTVTLNNCTAAINVVGNVGNTLKLSNTGGANVTSLNYSRATYDTTTATITGAVASGYTPQLRYGASEYATLYNTSGNGTLGGINYSYSKTGTTDFTITITGISTGITNIPAIYINAINQVQITFNTTGGDGTVSLSTGNYTIGSTITVYAAPALNNAFMGWTDSTNPGSIITSNPLVVQVSTARTYTAIFSNSLLDGVAVGATVGGEVRMVGFDENTITDNDEVTLIAVCYTGYTFSGWYVNGELLSGYGASARIKYSEIKDKMVVAMFAPINNNSTNGETDNDQTSDIV